jgi:hypothetical protein
MLQTKTQDRATSKELKKLTKKCDLDKDIINKENDEPTPTAKRKQNHKKKYEYIFV